MTVLTKWALPLNASSAQAQYPTGEIFISCIVVAAFVVWHFMFFVTTMKKVVFGMGGYWEESKTSGPSSFFVWDVVIGSLINLIVVIGWFGWAFGNYAYQLDYVAGYSLYAPQDYVYITDWSMSLILLLLWKTVLWHDSRSKRDDIKGEVYDYAYMSEKSVDEVDPKVSTSRFIAVVVIPTFILMFNCLYFPAYGYVNSLIYGWFPSATYGPIAGVNVATGIALALIVFFHVFSGIRQKNAMVEIYKKITTFDSDLFYAAEGPKDRQAIVKGYIPVFHMPLLFWLAYMFAQFPFMLINTDDLIKANAYFFGTAFIPFVLCLFAGSMNYYFAYNTAARFAWYCTQYFAGSVLATFPLDTTNQYQIGMNINYGFFLTAPASTAFAGVNTTALVDQTTCQVAIWLPLAGAAIAFWVYFGPNYNEGEVAKVNTASVLNDKDLNAAKTLAGMSKIKNNKVGSSN